MRAPLFSCVNLQFVWGSGGKNMFSPYLLRNDTVMAGSCRWKVLLMHHCTNHHFWPLWSFGYVSYPLFLLYTLAGCSLPGCVIHGCSQYRIPAINHDL